MNTAAIERSLSVLIVEDSAILVERLREILATTDGFDLADVVDTEFAALHVIRQSEADVVLLDLRLREGNGFAVLSTLPTLPKRPVVVVLSNYSLPEYRSAALNAGAQYFLDKGHEMEGLGAILKEIREQQLH